MKKINNIEEMIALGKQSDRKYWEHFIPSNYKSLDYPVVVYWDDPWDLHFHGMWAVLHKSKI